MINSKFFLESKYKQTALELGIAMLALFIAKYSIGFIIEKKLPFSIYEQKSILFSLHQSKFFLTVFMGSVLFSGLLFFKKVQFSKIEKQLLWICSGVLFIATALLDYNYYFDQAYLVDRVILLLLFLASFRYPAVLMPYCIHALFFIKQLQWPELSYYTFTDKGIFYDLIAFVSINAAIRSFLKLEKQDANTLTAVWVIYSMWYLLAGWGKVDMGWWDNNLVNLSKASFAYGWMSGYDQLKVSLVDLLTKFNIALVLLTICLECGVILLFINRKLAIALCIGLALFHAAIFFVSGIFFWKWMVFIVAFGVIVYRYKELLNDLFTLKNNVYAGLLCLFLFFSFPNATKLAWFDTKLVNLHKVNLLGENGKVVVLDASFFSPYDLVFAQNRFPYLIDKPTLVGTYGSTPSKTVAYDIYNLNAKEDFEKHIEQNGVNRYRDGRKQKFDTFLTKFIYNKIKQDSWFLPFSSPMHIWQGASQKRLKYEDDLDAIQVDYLELNVDNPQAFDTLFYYSYKIQ